MTDGTTTEQGRGGVGEGRNTESRAQAGIGEVVGGEKERKDKNFRLWLLQLLLTRLVEGRFEMVRASLRRMREAAAALKQQDRPAEEEIAAVKKQVNTFGLADLVEVETERAQFGKAMEKMVRGARLTDEEELELESLFRNKSEEVKGEVRLVLNLYRGLAAGEQTVDEVRRQSRERFAREWGWGEEPELASDLEEAVRFYQEGEHDFRGVESETRIRETLEETKKKTTGALKDVALGKFTLEQWVGAKRYEELRDLPLGEMWRRLFEKIERQFGDDDEQKREQYQNAVEVGHLNLRINQDFAFQQQLDKLEKENGKGIGRSVRELLGGSRSRADEFAKQYRNNPDNNYNWLLGEWDIEDVQRLLDRFFVPVEGGRSLSAIVSGLKDYKPGFAASGDAAREANEANVLFNTLKSADLKTFLERNYPDIEVRDRLVEYLGGVRQQLEEVMNLRRSGVDEIPKSYAQRMEEVDAQQQMARQAGRRGRQPIPQAAMAAAPEGGGEGPAGAVAPFAHDKWREELDTRVRESPRAAIEWALNFLIEKDLSERDQYYVMQTVKDYIAGAEGKLAPGDELWDLYTRATYQEYLGQLELWRALPNAQSEEQVMGILGRISVGDVEDLTVWGKDFSEWGGVKGFTYEQKNERGEQDFKIDMQNLRGEQKDLFDALEIRGSDIEALLESQYWFNKFQFATRGSPTNELRKQIFMEAMFRKMGGVVETDTRPGKPTGRFAERRYFFYDQNGERKELGDIKGITLHFGAGPRARPRTMAELADENLWLSVMGEVNWELTGKRSEMNKYIEGRRTIYRWDKHFHYDKYLSKLGTKGLDFLHGGYEQDGKRKPYLNTMQKDFVSVRAKDVLMPYLLNVGDLARPGKEGGKEVVLVKGVKSLLAGGDGDLAREITALLERKFLNSRGNWRDLELLRALFDAEKMPHWVQGKPELLRKLVFSEAERGLLAKAQWDQLFAYLFTRTQGTKLSRRELEYFIKRMGGEIQWDPDKPGSILRNPPEDEANGRFVIRFLPGRRQLDQRVGAQLFFESLSRQRMFWEVDEQDRFQKEANYMRQTGAQAPKMAAFTANPTADNLIEWLGPNFGFRPNYEVRETAFRNADAVLLAREGLTWANWYAERVKLTETGSVDFSDELDEDGYRVPKKYLISRLLTGLAHPIKTLKETGKAVGKAVKEPGRTLKDVVKAATYVPLHPIKSIEQTAKFLEENTRLILKGKTGLRGWEPLDAWARKNFIDKLWHSGMIDWWQKEKLMSRHIVPSYLPFPIPIIGPSINYWIISGLDSKKRWRQLLALPFYGIGLVTRPAWLYLWIHDWGQASTSFWNEVVAPNLAGENAKALQIPTGK